MDFELAKRERDRRLRKKVLLSLKLSRHMSPTGGVGGRTLSDIVDAAMPPDQKFEDDDHALALMRSLVDKGLIEEELLTRRRGQKFGLDFVRFKITAKGTSLCEESLMPDPDVYDERITEFGQ